MHRLLTFTILAICLTARGSAQDSVEIKSDPTDQSRPVSTLLNQIRQREKVSITYEDPRYSNSADIQDVTHQVVRNLSPAEEKMAPRILVPSGKPINFVYSPRALRTPKGAEETVGRMLREYQSLGGPTFIVIRDGPRLHVVPSEVLDGKGERISQDSILDTVINIPLAERDGAQLLQEICDQIQKQTGYKIDIGPGSVDLHDTRKSQQIDNQTARAALERVWDGVSAPGSFVWDLYYDPSDKSYGLSFSHVGLAGPAAR